MPLALAYTRDNSVVDEACWNYDGTEGSTCPTTCPDSPGASCAARDWTFDDLYYSGYGVTLSVSQIQNWLRTLGPLAVNLDMEEACVGSGGLVGDVLTCAGGDTRGHAVVLVGYCNNASSPGGGYWILKNSWGTSYSWGWCVSNDGFFKVGYGNCGIETDVLGVDGVYEKTGCSDACESGGYPGSSGVCRSPAASVCCYKKYGAAGCMGRCVADISQCTGAVGCTPCIPNACTEWPSACSTCGYACDPSYTDVINIPAETAMLCSGSTYPGKYVCLPGEVNVGGGSGVCPGTYDHCCCNI
jgi:hypothetical protein